MQTAADKHLQTLESELNFIARQVQQVDGNGESDFEALHNLGLSVNSALRALFEHKLSLQEATEEVPAGVTWPEAA